MARIKQMSSSTYHRIVTTGAPSEDGPEHEVIIARKIDGALKLFVYQDGVLTRMGPPPLSQQAWWESGRQKGKGKGVEDEKVKAEDDGKQEDDEDDEEELKQQVKVEV
ncbi:hypothetical protein LTR64_008317 [Lithohypha guttulata]|uniref:uncharacterized protein n=1 Tax=Lithohypha guttulata TaxID=1690604 RepID=UPI002DDED6C4|nr:hypothetical protein LTR51_008469 [Lithohypha guttulata]